MDINNNSGATVGNNLNNNQESIKIRPSYSSVVSNTHIKRNNKNIRQLQHELLNSKSKFDNSILSPSDKIHNDITLKKSKKTIDDSLAPSTTTISNEKNNEKRDKKNGNNNNPSLKIITSYNIKNNDQQDQNSDEMKSSALTSVEDIISPIEKVKVDDCYSIPIPNTTPIPSNTVSLTDVSSSSVSILSPTSPTSALNSNTNLTNSYVINELPYHIKEKIQTELLKIYNVCIIMMIRFKR